MSLCLGRFTNHAKDLLRSDIPTTTLLPTHLCQHSGFGRILCIPVEDDVNQDWGKFGGTPPWTAVHISPTTDAEQLGSVCEVEGIGPNGEDNLRYTSPVCN